MLFKLMSLRLKKAAARQEADLMLVRTWYGDLMTLATAQMELPASQTSSSSGLHRLVTNAGQILDAPDSKRRNTGSGKGKHGQIKTNFNNQNNSSADIDMITAQGGAFP